MLKSARLLAIQTETCQNNKEKHFWRSLPILMHTLGFDILLLNFFIRHLQCSEQPINVQCSKIRKMLLFWKRGCNRKNSDVKKKLGIVLNAPLNFFKTPFLFYYRDKKSFRCYRTSFSTILPLLKHSANVD